MSTTRSKSRFASVRSLFCIGVAATGLLAASGCDESEVQQTITECDARAVQVENADGTCSWVSSCDVEGQTLCNGEQEYECQAIPAEACAIDTRCEVVTATLCPGCDPSVPADECVCSTDTYCDDKPGEGCADLDEMSCINSDVCHAEYGWNDGFGGAEPTDPNGDQALPAPPIPEWGFLGCVDNSTGPCADLDQQSCENHPSCAPIWGSDCPPCAPGEDCACATIATFVGCEQVPGGTCSGLTDPIACDAAADCHWEYEWANDPIECECAPGDDTCVCTAPAPIPSDGSCVDDYPTDRCEDILDPGTCYAVGCEWLDDGTGQRPIPEPDPNCECPVDEPECDINCTAPAPPLETGLCVPPTQNCYDFYDEFACVDNGCQWTGWDGADPAPEPDPCTCPPDDPTCGCAGLVAPPEGYCEPPVGNDCYDYGDEGTCSTDPRCEWYAAPGMAPPCDPSDPECGADIIACPEGAEFQASGMCVGPDGFELPEFCCEGSTGGAGICDYKQTVDPCEGNADELSCTSAPDCEWLPAPCACDDMTDPECLDCVDAGVCVSEGVTPPPPTCAYGDERMCLDNGCAWEGVGEACECDPATDPLCDCIDGYCTDPQPGGCSVIADPATCTDTGCVWNDIACDCDPATDPMCECPESFCADPSTRVCENIEDPTTCDAAAGCGWVDGAGLIACDPDGRFDDAGICRDSQGNEQLEVCCDPNQPPPPMGMCLATP